ncbi:MAG: helix-hairpin-helix domain-containing protein, partial [Candidatus Thorarchaeota archaeon]
GVVLMASDLLLPAVISFLAVIAAVMLRPWKLDQAPLAVQGLVLKYFRPMVLILAAHMLWFFVTKLRFQEEGLGTLSQTAGFGVFEVGILIVGVVGAGFLADFQGRKNVFSTLILLMGLLTIFGSAMYEIYFSDPSSILGVGSLVGLLVFERFIEGYMLGLCLLLIWSELGPSKTKGLRLSLVWFFFLGYMALFWAVDLEATVFGFSFLAPEELATVGGNVAVFLSLIALYMIGPLPQILGREIEMEELALNFDDRQVKRTVDAFVGRDDFDSIRSQLDLLDAGAEISEVSDKDMSEILGDDFAKMLPLRRVPGIGPNLERKLRRAGYESAAQLSGETPKRLAEKIDSLGVARAEKIISDARKILKRTIKPTRKRNRI